jgi:hypothetical protein
MRPQAAPKNRSKPDGHGSYRYFSGRSEGEVWRGAFSSFLWPFFGKLTEWRFRAAVSALATSRAILPAAIARAPFGNAHSSSCRKAPCRNTRVLWHSDGPLTFWSDGAVQLCLSPAFKAREKHHAAVDEQGGANHIVGRI